MFKINLKEVKPTKIYSERVQSRWTLNEFLNQNHFWSPIIERPRNAKRESVTSKIDFNNAKTIWKSVLLHNKNISGFSRQKFNPILSSLNKENQFKVWFPLIASHKRSLIKSRKWSSTWRK